MAMCDLCGKNCRAVELAQLLDSYRTGDVTDICTDCAKWANKLKSDMLLEVGPRMREAIAARKGSPVPSPRFSLFRRLIGASK